MLLDKVLKLGNPILYKVSNPVEKNELPQLESIIGELHDILMEFRSKYNAGRAIAAPQIGVLKKLIYLNIGSTETMT